MRSASSKRRTTLTLPNDALSQAERIARARQVNLSTVIGELLAEGLRAHAETAQSREILARYQKAFSGFSEDGLLLLDGIVPESELKPKRRLRRR